MPRYSMSLHSLALAVLVVFLLLSVPVMLYLSARNSGQPLPFAIPRFGNGTPEGVSVGSQPVRLADLQNLPTPLLDPMSPEDCFVFQGGTCQFTNWATASGTIELEIDRPTIPNNMVSLGLFWGYQGTLQQHYQSGLASGGQASEPLYRSVRRVLEQGNLTGINPMFLLAYYDFILAESQRLGIQPRDLGLPLSEADLLTPDPADVASTFRVARALFMTDEDLETTGQTNTQIQLADDRLSAWLKKQEMSEAGRMVVYVTAQLFGTEFAGQVFTQRQKLFHHYSMIFRDPRFAGIHPITISPLELSSTEFFSRNSPYRELILCKDNRAVTCTYSFSETTLGGGAEVGTCVGVPFFNSSCTDGSLQPLY